MPSFLTYGSLSMKVAGALIALYGIWLVVAEVRAIISAKKIGPLNISSLIAALYLFGLASKAAMVGPAWMRWHLSDIGFPVFIGYHVLFLRWWDGFKKNPVYTTMSSFELDQKYVELRKKMLLIAFGLSVLYELVVGFLYSLRPEVTPTMVGNLDWVDILCYTIGTGVALLDIGWAEKTLEVRKNLIEQAARERATAELNAAREARRQPRNQPRKRRR